MIRRPDLIDYVSTFFGVSFIFLAGFLARGKWDHDRSRAKARQILLHAMLYGFDDEVPTRVGIWDDEQQRYV